MREYFLMYVASCPNLDRVARNFYYHDFWRTFSCRPIPYFTLLPTASCEGELRNEIKYTELAYLKTISGNSGVQKRMAYGSGTNSSIPEVIIP